METMGAAMKNLKICYALKGFFFKTFYGFQKCLGIRLGRGEKARGQIVIGTPGTCMDWVVRYKSVDPSLIKVRNTLATSSSFISTFNPVGEHCKCGLKLYFGHQK